MSMTAQAYFGAGEALLDRLARPGLLCAFDFDGTLAPIVRDPGQVAVPAAVLWRLERLAARTTVAIITGRSVADLQHRLPLETHYVVGNHGLEGLPDTEAQASAWRAACGAWEAALGAALARERRAAAGIFIENKGCSLSLHYRTAPDRAAAAQWLAMLCRELAPAAHVIGGKCVFNLLPEAGINKGYALERLIESCGAHAALYVGDDVTDEDVFRLQRPDLIGVRIERDPASSAQFFLPHRLDLVRLLDGLLSRLPPAG